MQSFYKSLLAFLIISIQLVCKAQSNDQYIDSMQWYLNSKLPIKEVVFKIDSLYDEYFWMTGSPKAYQILLATYQLSEEKDYAKGKLKLLGTLAQYNFRQGNLELALKQRLKGLKLSEQLKDTNAIGSINLAMGEIYKLQKNYPLALKHELLALQFEENFIHKKRRIGVVNSMIGSLYFEMGKDSLALFHQFKALKIRQELEEPLAVAASMGYIGQVYYKKNNLDLASNYITQSLNARLEYEDYGGVVFAANILGDIYQTKKQFELAKKQYQISLKAALQLNSKVSLRDCYFKLAENSKKLNDIKNVVYYQDQYVAYNDSVINADNLRNMAQMKEIYESGKKDSEINLLNKEKDLDKLLLLEQEQKIRSRNMIVLISLVSILLLGILVFIIFRSNKEKQRTNLLLSQKNALIEEKSKEILDSINYAKRIQYTLLAHSDFLKDNIPNHFVYFNPKDIVSGDFYWAAKKGDKFYLAVCDSTGHGVPGAFMSLLNIGFLTEAINEKGIEKPNEVFGFVRQRLIDNISKDGQRDGFDGILICMDQSNQQITYAAANNSPILISNHQFAQLASDRMPVGMGERKEDYKLFTIDYKKGDTLYLYTDGYADQFGGPKGKKLKYKVLNQLLLNSCEKPLAEQGQLLKESFEAWRGNLEQVDDVCVIGIRL